MAPPYLGQFAGMFSVLEGDGMWSRTLHNRLQNVASHSDLVLKPNLWSLLKSRRFGSTFNTFPNIILMIFFSDLDNFYSLEDWCTYSPNFTDKFGGNKVKESQECNM